MTPAKIIDPWTRSDKYPWTKMFYIAAELIDYGWPGELAFKEAQTRYENYLMGVHCDKAQ